MSLIPTPGQVATPGLSHLRAKRSPSAPSLAATTWAVRTAPRGASHVALTRAVCTGAPSAAVLIGTADSKVAGTETHASDPELNEVQVRALVHTLTRNCPNPPFRSWTAPALTPAAAAFACRTKTP